jgi:hypothetical protein
MNNENTNQEVEFDFWQPTNNKPKNNFKNNFKKQIKKDKYNDYKEESKLEKYFSNPNVFFLTYLVSIILSQMIHTHSLFGYLLIFAAPLYLTAWNTHKFLTKDKEY